MARRLKVGDSLAVDGCCLTVAEQINDRSGAVFYLNAETERCTNLANLGRGDEVHVEESLSLAKGLGGHLVSGHVDTKADVVKFEAKTGGWDLWVELSREWSKFVFPKSSLVVDGVSLTVNELIQSPSSLILCTTLIPTTLEKTHFSKRDPARWTPNIEFDFIGKMVAKQVEVYLDNLNGIS